MDMFSLFHGHFGWLLWALIFLGVIWVWNGGVYRPIAHEGAYLKPLAPIDSGQAYGAYYAGTPRSNRNETLNLPETPAKIIRSAESLVSSFLTQSKAAEALHREALSNKSVFIDGVAGAKQDLEKREYVRLVMPKDTEGAIQLTGMYLKSTYLPAGIKIPEASVLPVLGRDSVLGDIIMMAGDRAIISTGESPIGESFRVNVCSGYLAQFQEYTPALRNSCPTPEDELLQAGLGKDKACAEITENLSSCSIYRGAIDPALSDSCKTFITERLTYNGCVAAHRYDENFYSNEWRVFLGQKKEIWNDGNDIIILYNSRGDAVDALSY